MRKLIAVLSCVLVARTAVAQNYYVRQSAAGAADGSDWTNAYPDLPASMQRGATYYLAAGSYAGHTFNDPQSGTKIITVKKATVADHGTTTGWSDAYASGTALFTGTLVFMTGYYTIDGQTGGGPGSWTSGLGIRIHPTARGYEINIMGPNSYNPPMPTHFVFRHIDIQGAGYHAPQALTPDGTVISTHTTNSSQSASYLTYQYCYLHDFQAGHPPFQILWLNHLTIEYCDIARNYSVGASHSEGLMMNAANYVNIRYNRWEDIEGTAVVSIGRQIPGNTINNDLNIYGNIFFCTPAETIGVGMGIVAQDIYSTDTTYVVTNALIYNNTIVNCTAGVGWGVNVPYGTGNQVYDNLWVNSSTAVTIGTDSGDVEDYNTLINCTGRPAWFTGASDKIYSSGDPFVNEGADDFRLAAHTDPGLAVPAPYNVDMLGHTTAADGIWDRGALQYSDVSAEPPRSNSGDTPTGETAVGCACSASRSGPGGAGLGLLLAFVGCCANRGRRRIARETDHGRHHRSCKGSK